jgi:hypothetical protein
MRGASQWNFCVGLWNADPKAGASNRSAFNIQLSEKANDAQQAGIKT